MKECPTCQRCYEDDQQHCPDDGESLAQALEGPLLLGEKYLVERRLAQGGMGAIYVGVDKRLNRRVALKGILDRRFLDSATKARLLREARILSTLEHPNICRIYDFIEVPGAAFLVLELVHGKTLQQAMRAEELDERFRMRIAYAVGSVLVAAHGAGVIHRDLKPDNVMLTPDGGIKVLDFGIARPLDVEAARRTEGDSADSKELAAATLTLPGLVLGTPQYMSPEQARSKPLTAASDMYSFGLLLQELFTGEPAYDVKLPLGRLLIQVTEGQTREVHGVDPDLAVLISRLKSPSISARPTAVDAVAHLQQIRDKPLQQLRRRLRLLGTALLVAATVAMGLLTTRYVEVARQAEVQARLARARQLTAEAATLHASQLDLALLLSLEAQGLSDTPEERSAVLAALAASPRLQRFLRGHPARVDAVAWSPDGTTLAAASYRTIVLWDPFTGSRRLEIESPGGTVRAVAFSPDGQLLAGGSNDGTIHLWRSADGRPAGDLAGHRAAVRTLAWNEDGLLASGSADNTVRFWDTAAGRQRGAALTGHSDPIEALAWRDTSLLASGAADGRIKLWEPASGQLKLAFDAHRGTVEDLTFDRHGDLYSAGADGIVRVWDPLAGERTRPPLAAHPAGATSLTISSGGRSDGRELATGGRDKTIRLFDLAESTLDSQVLVGHGDEVLAVAWSPDGETLASSSIDRSVALWDRTALRPEGRVMRHEGDVTSLAADGEGHLLVSGGYDVMVRLWDTRTGHQVRPPLAGHRSPVTAVALDHGSQLVASADMAGRIALRSLADDESLRPPWRGHDGPVRALAFNGDVLISAGDDRSIRLWKLQDSSLQATAEGHQDGVLGLAVSPDGTLLASGGPSTILVWELGDRLSQVAVAEGRGQPAWRADGARLAFSNDAWDVVLWDVDGQRPAGRRLEGHTAPVLDLAWHAGGRFLASASEDKTVLLWDTEEGELLARIQRQGPVSAVLWLDDVLASAASDRRILLHDIGGGPEAWRARACRRAGRNLSQAEWERFLGPQEPYRATCPEFPSSAFVASPEEQP